MARTASGNPELNYGELIRVRVAPFQRKELMKQAEASGKTLSQYIRGILLPIIMPNNKLQQKCPTCGHDL